eukprot:m.112513 g.112513  ORF g.112513 m.112513 type:complete len:66 (-) comp17032_c1_seq21:3523-3720(-)
MEVHRLANLTHVPPPGLNCQHFNPLYSTKLFNPQTYQWLDIQHRGLMYVGVPWDSVPFFASPSRP